jgi:hypothetical protein
MLSEERIILNSKVVLLPLQLSSAQARTARAALAFSVEEVASAAGLTSWEIGHFEKGGRLRAKHRAAIRAALEAAGIEFRVQEAPSVRLRRARSA